MNIIHHAIQTPVRYILDTNIWLDWFVFTHEPAAPMTALKNTLLDSQNNQTHPHCAILMTPAMWEEWVDVLGRPQFKVEAERQVEILNQTRAMVQWVETPPAPHERIRCSDKDDQIFIDGALVMGVQWLLSKDRHLLKLRNRARRSAVNIVTPEQWHKLQPQQPSRDELKNTGGA